MSNIRKSNGMVGAAVMTASALLVKVLGFIYKIPLSYYLGDEGMGYYNAALTVYAVFYILSASAIPKAFSIILTRARVNNTKKAYRITLSLFSLLFFVIGLFCSIVLHFCSKRISLLLGVANAFYAIRMIAPAVCISSVGALCRGYLLSYNRLIPVAISEAMEALLKLLCGLLFIIKRNSIHFSLEEISAYAVSGIAIGALVSFVFLLLIISFSTHKDNEEGGLPFSLSAFSTSTIRVMLPLTLTTLVVSFSNLLELTLINRGLSSLGVSVENAMAQYGNYTTLVLPLFSFVSSLSAAYCLSEFPNLVKAFEEKREGIYFRMLNDAMPPLFVFSVLMFLGFYFFGEDYFLIFFSENNVAQGAALLQIMSPSVLFISLSTFFNSALEARGNTFAPLFSLGVASALKIPLSIILIRRFGIYGSAFASVVAYAVMMIISYILFIRKTKRGILRARTALQAAFGVILSFSVSLSLKQYLVRRTQAPCFRLLPICVCALLYLWIVNFMLKKKTVKRTIWHN